MPGKTGNLLLDALSADLRDTILSQCRHMELPVRTLLHEQGERPAHVYFICSGIVSIVITMAEGGSAEVGLIGREGLVGAMQLLGSRPTPSQAFVQLQGDGLRMRRDDLKALFASSRELRDHILAFIQQQNITLEQIAACNKLHEAEQRLSRWLLMMRDRTGSDTMTMTQEFMADMLGTRRTTVTLVASSLQQRGLISYRRGKISIVSCTELERAACDCYRICNEALTALYT